MLSRRAVLSRRLLTPMADNVFLIEESSDPASMEEEGCPGEFHLEGVTLFSVSIFGILGNLFFIIIFSSRKKAINTFHSIMVCLAYFDIVYLTSAVFIFSLPVLWPGLANSFFFTRSITLLLPTAHISINGTQGQKKTENIYVVCSQILHSSIA